MAEGHTIHRIARDHERHFAGRRLGVVSPQGRFAEGARVLHGKTLERVEAWGKNLYYTWEGGVVLHVHLGMAGRFPLVEAPAPPPDEQVRLRIEAPCCAADLRGPMVCALVSPVEAAAQQAELGPDVLRSDADPERAWARVHKTRRAFGVLLMDQAVFAGVGNIFRCEVLFAAGVAPDRPGNAVARAEFDRVWALLGKLMRAGVRRNRILSVEVLEPARATNGHAYYVYKQRACLRCGEPVSAWKLSGRTVYACKNCQK
jgi:endonuclease VIII